MSDQQIETVLSAIRRLIRATDLNSRDLVRKTGLTTPQLLLLQTVGNLEDSSISALASAMSLSQATVTNIVERLENRQLVQRKRSESDRRKVYVLLTAKARKAIRNAPAPMQENFVSAFTKLEKWEQTMIISSLQRLAHMMDAETLDAAPVLQVGAIAGNDESV